MTGDGYGENCNPYFLRGIGHVITRVAGSAILKKRREQAKDHRLGADSRKTTKKDLNTDAEPRHFLLF